jgi:hypothetical protein
MLRIKPRSATDTGLQGLICLDATVAAGLGEVRSTRPRRRAHQVRDLSLFNVACSGDLTRWSLLNLASLAGAAGRLPLQNPASIFISAISIQHYNVWFIWWIETRIRAALARDSAAFQSKFQTCHKGLRFWVFVNVMFPCAALAR